MTVIAADDAAKSYWQRGGQSQQRAADVLRNAFGAEPLDPIVAGRIVETIVDISERYPLPSDSIRQSVATLQTSTDAASRAAHAIDDLGDEGTSPAVVFDHLGEAAEPLQVILDSKAADQLRRNQPNRIVSGNRVVQSMREADPQSEVLEQLGAIGATLATRAERFGANALFATALGGLVLGARVVTDSSGAVTPFAEVAHDLENQANLALHEALPPGAGARWNLEWGTVPSEGESIGLALYVAANVALGKLASDPLLASTGRLDIGGVILPVEGIKGKLRAAARSGIRRVLLPTDNRAEALSAIAENALPLTPYFVANTREVRAALTAVSLGSQPSFAAQVKFVKSLLRLENVTITDDPREKFHRLVVENLAGKATLDVYTTGSLVIGGKVPSLLEILSRVKSKAEGPAPERRERLTLNIPASHRAAVRDTLLQSGAADVGITSDNEEWRFRLVSGKSQVLLIQYRSGKLDIPAGTAPAFDQALQAVRTACPGLDGLEVITATKSIANHGDGDQAIDESRPYIGTDEAGKGDYFGPLVSAAVFVDAALSDRLRALHVRDSKLISSDSAVRKLAGQVREVARGRYKVTPIPPKTYNQLEAQMRAEGKNTNTLLAWGHMRSVEDLIKDGLQPAFIVSDQFGDPRYIEQKLLTNTRASGVKVIQQPKAERYIAVAAASILARDGFLDWLEKASERLGTVIPKGVSPAVIELAQKLYASGGDAQLNDYVKVSFRTTAQVRR